MKRVIIALALVVAVGCQPPPLPQLPTGDLAGTPAADSTLLGCELAGTRLQVTSSAHLDPACTYGPGIDVTASGVTLDCRGATIDPGDDRSGVGIHVHGPVDVPLHDVEVRNCVTRGFTNGIRVSRDGFRDLEPGHEYDVSTADIRLVNNDVAASNGSGIFVNAYVTGVTITRQRVHDAGGPGIYLEAGSKGTVVEHSTISENGYAATRPPGETLQLGTVTFGYLGTGREGIAVDGSTGNVIRDNVIGGNALGGILLYENCGEFATQRPGQWWPRNSGANGNRIERNVIAAETNGVWVGSRMAENVYFFDCSDTPYVDSGLVRITLDHATDNVVRDNTFVRTVHGIRVEDDRTTITGNRFLGAHDDPEHPAAEAVLVGTKHRTEVLGLPVVGTTIDANVVELDGIDAPYTWIHAPVPGLAPGVQPPIDPFLLVAEVWVVSE